MTKWWEVQDGDYLYASTWNEHIKEIFSKIQSKKKLYFGKVENDFAQYFGGILAFPSTSTVYAANDNGVITLKPFAKVQGKDGELALYSPIPSADATFPNENYLEEKGWAYFKDTTTYVEIPDSATLQLNNISIVVIIELEELSGAILLKGDKAFTTVGLQSYLLGIREWNSDWGVRFDHTDGTLTWYTVPISTLETNKVMVLAATYDGANVRLYKDGQELGVWAETRAINQVTYPVHISDPNGAIKGKVFHVYLYNRAITIDELQRIQERPYDPPTDGLVLWLNPKSIDEINGVWNDLSGNNNNGTLFNVFTCVPSQLTYVEEAYRLQTGTLTAQGDRKDWWFKVGNDILPGKYKVVVRLKDNNVADDIRITLTDVSTGAIIYQKTFTTGIANAFTLIESDPIDLTLYNNRYVEVSVEKATINANTIDIDYVVLDPYEWTPEIYYVVSDSDRHIGEVKVWDTMGVTDETQWVRVFNKEHKFIGDCVIENGLFRLVCKSTGVYEELYVYDGIGWQLISQQSALVYDTTTLSSGSERIVELDGDMVVVLFERFGNNSMSKFRVIVNRFGIIVEPVVSDPSKRVFHLYGTDQFITYSSLDGVYDRRFNPYSFDYSGLGKLYAISFDGSKNLILGASYNIDGNTSVGVGKYNKLTIYKDFTSLCFAGLPFNTANLFKEAESVTLSKAPDPLTYTDDFSNDTSARYAIILGSGWTWDTVNGILNAYSDTQAVQSLKLKSLKFASGEYSVDIRINSTATINRFAGIIFGAQSDFEANHYLVRLALLDTGGADLSVFKKIDGVYYLLGSAAVTATAGTWYNIKISWNASTGSIDVYFDGSATPIISVSDTTFNSGYVGLRAYILSADVGVGNLDVSFDNFNITATEVVGRGAQVNRYLDDFDWDSSAEYTVNLGSVVWDTNAGVLRLDAGEDTTKVTLNSLKFGTGTYKVKIKFSNIDAGVGEHAGLMLCRDPTNDYYYYVYVRPAGSSGGNTIYLWKKTASGAITIASATIDASADVWHDLQVDYNASTGQFNVYWDGSLVITAIDTELEPNKIGLKRYSAVGATSTMIAEFDDLEINAEEVTSSDNTCVILGGVNHGGRLDYNEAPSLLLICGTDIPAGEYLSVVRLKSTASPVVTYSIRNYSDGITYQKNVSVTIDGEPTFKLLSLTGDYAYYVRPIRLNSDDDGDTILFNVWDAGGNNNPAIVVDYFLLIPISGLESETLMPQDIAVRSMVYTEYVDDAVDKAFDVRDEVVYGRKPMSATFDRITIKRVSGDFGGAFAAFNPSDVIPDPNEGDMFIAHDTNATTPEVRLYVYSGGSWRYVTFV